MGKCKDCIWYNTLWHNYRSDTGHRKSGCCTIEFESKAGDITQVLPNCTCGDFTARDGTDFFDEHIRPDGDVDIVYCGECAHLHTEVADGQRHYSCNLHGHTVYPATGFCSDGRKI